jgi:hypothetical protein
MNFGGKTRTNGNQIATAAAAQIPDQTPSWTSTYKVHKRGRISTARTVRHERAQWHLTRWGKAS